VLVDIDPTLSRGSTMPWLATTTSRTIADSASLSHSASVPARPSTAAAATGAGRRHTATRGADGQWTLLAQTYPSPIPADPGLSNTRVLDLASAFNGRRLCENTVGLYEEMGIADWTAAGAVDQTEWVNQIRTVSTCCADSPYYIQESIHPNYWGQLATRSCVRQAWNGGSPRGGRCGIAGPGLANGEPVMSLG
jgi:hypothetical protein